MINKKKPAVNTVFNKKSFTIVAIGASAGGLEAITKLLQNLPTQTGMAFIYIQHLSPDHKSILASLLSKVTSMKVQEVKNRMLIVPDNLYVIPPDKEMILLNGHIKLTPRGKDRKLNLPIDTFFCSLAEKHKERAIGIILSGSASDGTRGMKSIKHEGGLTFAQDDSAKFNSMPKSAIAAGAVDFILSPKEIALELVRLSKHPFIKSTGLKISQEDLIDNSNPDLKEILQQVQAATGVDFNVYKMNTIKRRIIRRMLLYKLKTLKEYGKLVAEKSNEIDILYQDLLINVTGFFRDNNTHQFLKTNLFPRLINNKKEGEVLRIWVVACSSGEEAYSFAMMIQEIQDTNSTNIPVQIFATDLSGKSIKKARIGVYSLPELEAVSPKRIQRFYTKCDGGYRINKQVRDMCVFALHNILHDPPFSRLDFISCCNLLIYLDTAAQKKIISTFHYAVNENGYLMLGKSESISSSVHLFNNFNKRYKIYAKKNNSGARNQPVITTRFLPAGNPGNTFPENMPAKHVSLKKIPPVAAQGLDSAIDAVLVSDFMPASVVINHEMEILQFRGSTDLFLTHSPGRATFNILKMVRPEIAFDLRTLISKVIKSKTRELKNGIELKVDNRLYTISLIAVPLKFDWEVPLLLILFSGEESDKIGAEPNRENSKSISKDRRIKKLELELANARNEARIYAQEQEAFSEELQSANEEVVSSNEELQSVNEELETSKEEIESTNEELTTTNQELQTRNDLLNESYEYSEAISSTIHEPMIILDKNLRVISANRSFYKKFGVKDSDIEGILFFKIGNGQWDIPALRDLLEDVIPKRTHFHDFEVIHNLNEPDEKIMLLNASRIEQKIHGVQLILVAINDITERATLQKKEKELYEKALTESNSYNQKLKQAVEERTRELEWANNKLEEKNVELVKMNKELQSFAYISSHDLQEPLRKIQTFAARILEKENESLSDSGKDYFSRMQKAANRMQLLIDDLLAFSHVNVTERKFENTDLNVIAKEVISELKESIGEKNATITISGLCEINIIPFQFRQLLQNLLTNSLKFSNPGKPIKILIKCRLVSGSKLIKETPSIITESPGWLVSGSKYWHISVSDNGIGFEPHFKERIFGVFQKLHRREQYPGTGIGLAIVKKIVENHNGIIVATGMLNKGATFDIYIPV